MCIHLFQFSTFHYIYICLSYMYPCPAYSNIFFMVCLPIKIHLSDKLLLIGILKISSQVAGGNPAHIELAPSSSLCDWLSPEVSLSRNCFFANRIPYSTPTLIFFRSCLCFNIIRCFFTFNSVPEQTVIAYLLRSSTVSHVL